MGRNILPQSFAFRAHHQRDLAGAHRAFQLIDGIAIEPDPPIASLGNVVERAGQIDHPDPWHCFQSAGRRLCHDSRFWRGVAVLGDDRGGIEGCSRT